jgi:hypothetical protein
MQTILKKEQLPQIVWNDSCSNKYYDSLIFFADSMSKLNLYCNIANII